MAIRGRKPTATPISFKQRARLLGLKQRTIAALLGASEGWVSLEIRRARPAQRIRSIIAAWGMMTPSQRGEWLHEAGLGGLVVLRQRIVTPYEDQEAQWPASAPELAGRPRTIAPDAARTLDQAAPNH